MIIGGITLGITTVIADTIINSTSVAYKTTTVKAALDELYDIADFKQEVKDMLYPVGSIYISVSSTDPSELFGGTWESFGMGRTLVGVGRALANTNESWGSVDPGNYLGLESEFMAGEYWHTLTIDEMPSHTHSVGFSPLMHADRPEGNGSTGLEKGNPEYLGMRWWFDARIPTTSPAGSGNQHANVQPYISVYMWKRTA